MSDLYVLGFMFDEAASQVALIKKNKPDWQAGFLNGIGGKIEKGETPIQAMVREFEEETGYNTQEKDWQNFGAMISPNWGVGCFASKGDISKLKNMTNEAIYRVRIDDLIQGKVRALANVPGLVTFALEKLSNKNFGRMNLEYLK